MDISLGELNKLSITKLKEIIKKLTKEPKNAQILTTINIIKNLIIDKKRKGIILHSGFVKTPTGMIREKKCKPIHLQ